MGDSEVRGSHTETHPRRAVTIRDVASHAGVSAMTVSRVLNDGKGMREDTRQRVQRAIDELGYIPNLVARDLSRRRTGSLAILVPDIGNSFFTLIVRGAAEVARAEGYRVMLCHTEGQLSVEADYLRDGAANRVEGILAAPVNDESYGHFQSLQQRHVPFVLLDRSIPGLAADLVQGDNRFAAEQLVGRLLQLGHRRVAMVGGSPGISSTRERVAGYRAALAAAGIAADAGVIIPTEGHDVEAGREVAPQVLALRPAVTAVFAINNLVALGILLAARQAGVEIPRDLALVCVDDIEHASLLDPFLTVARQPADRYGRIAMRMLLDRIEGFVGPPRSVELRPELVIRRSCG